MESCLRVGLNLYGYFGTFRLVNGKDQLDIMMAVPMKGTCKMCVRSEANLDGSLLIVESGNGTTVEGHSCNCQTAAFELSESVELCRITTEDLHV